MKPKGARDEIRNYIDSLDGTRMDHKIRLAASKYGYTEGGIKSLYYGTCDNRRKRDRGSHHKLLNYMLKLGYQDNIITKYLAS